MKIKNLITLCLILFLIYVTVGDILLPSPYNAKSKQIRQDINQLFIGLFPKKEFKNIKRKKNTWEKIEQDGLKYSF